MEQDSDNVIMPIPHPDSVPELLPDTIPDKSDITNHHSTTTNDESTDKQAKTPVESVSPSQDADSHEEYDASYGMSIESNEDGSAKDGGTMQLEASTTLDPANDDDQKVSPIGIMAGDITATNFRKTHGDIESVVTSNTEKENTDQYMGDPYHITILTLCQSLVKGQESHDRIPGEGARYSDEEPCQTTIDGSIKQSKEDVDHRPPDDSKVHVKMKTGESIPFDISSKKPTCIMAKDDKE